MSQPAAPQPADTPTSATAEQLDPAIAARLTRTPDGLVPAIAQDVHTGRVLMMAWMDDTALARTLATRRATYFSRSRSSYWVKGETSGHVQHVRSVELDCDGDTILLRVEQTGSACHRGTFSCFDTLTLLADSKPTEPTPPTERTAH